ncbi:hypothetical protein C8R47DRAFT_1081846 [Mycena vitilis]|nr:hypothetical protein C8R47DRAFT_1081846 [Mycena vitilis]
MGASTRMHDNDIPAVPPGVLLLLARTHTDIPSDPMNSNEDAEILQLVANSRLTGYLAGIRSFSASFLNPVDPRSCGALPLETVSRKRVDMTGEFATFAALTVVVADCVDAVWSPTVFSLAIWVHGNRTLPYFADDPKLARDGKLCLQCSGCGGMQWTRTFAQRSQAEVKYRHRYSIALYNMILRVLGCELDSSSVCRASRWMANLVNFRPVRIPVTDGIDYGQCIRLGGLCRKDLRSQLVENVQAIIAKAHHCESRAPSYRATPGRQRQQEPPGRSWWTSERRKARSRLGLVRSAAYLGRRDGVKTSESALRNSNEVLFNRSTARNTPCRRSIRTALWIVRHASRVPLPVKLSAANSQKPGNFERSRQRQALGLENNIVVDQAVRNDVVEEITQILVDLYRAFRVLQATMARRSPCSRASSSRRGCGPAKGNTVVAIPGSTVHDKAAEIVENHLKPFRLVHVRQEGPHFYNLKHRPETRRRHHEGGTWAPMNSRKKVIPVRVDEVVPRPYAKPYCTTSRSGVFSRETTVSLELEDPKLCPSMTEKYGPSATEARPRDYLADELGWNTSNGSQHSGVILQSFSNPISFCDELADPSIQPSTRSKSLATGSRISAAPHFQQAIVRL